MHFDRVKVEPVGRSTRYDDKDQPVSADGWTCRSYSQNKDGVPGLPVVIYIFGDNLIRVMMICGTITSVEVNLALLLFGDHGHLLKSDAEIIAALALLEEMLDQISIKRNPATKQTWIFKSIELGWNFPGPFSFFEARVAPARHRWVRRPAQLTRGQAFKFDGENFALKFYDKGRLLKRCGEGGSSTAPMTRVEVVLKGKKLREVTGLNGPVETISFADACSWLRHCVELLDVPDAVKTAGEVDRLAELCLLADRDRYFPNGRRVFDLLTDGACAKSAYRLRKRMAALQPMLDQWKWSNLFPANSWPPPHEL